jgi:hypothetical protein
MVVEFSIVFKRLAGVEELNIELEQAITVEKFVVIIAAIFKAFTKYSLMKEKESFGVHLNSVQDGRLLQFSDLVNNQDHKGNFARDWEMGPGNYYVSLSNQIAENRSHQQEIRHR